MIAASAGNHAQGVAYSARHLGLRAVIVMPKTTPEIKVEAVRGMGAEVVLAGDSYSEAKAHCDGLVAETGLAFVHPFDDPLVIAGQGTIGEEILRQCHGRMDAVFVPVGGGGLIAGVAGYLKAVMPGVKVIGVEPFEADAMYRSLEAGKRVHLDRVGIFADGVAVREVGEETFRIARECVDGVVRVTNDEICAAIKDVFDETRSVMEPAGALAVAGLKAWAAREGKGGERLVAILSGANMNFDRLRFVSERAEVGEAREALLGVTIPERPGAFREFCAAIGPRVVTEFNYRLAGRAAAHIFVGLKTASREDGRAVAAGLRERGYETLDLTDDEMAKLHVRHMVGGRASARDERLYRFEFPERPGRAHGVPREARRALEHQPLPLPQPRRRLRPRAGGVRGAGRRARRAAGPSSTASAIPRSARAATRPTRSSWPATAPESRPARSAGRFGVPGRPRGEPAPAPSVRRGRAPPPAVLGAGPDSRFKT